MARRRFFVEAVRNGEAEITGEEALHLSRVLRVEAGQKFEISDNRQAWLAEITEARKSAVRFRVIEPVDPGPEPPPVHLFASLFKFDRFELLVEKATELGVGRIVPVEAARSDRGLAEAAAKRVERWRRIAREASQQARRLREPEIAEPVRLRQVRASGYTFRLDERAGTEPLDVPANWSSALPVSALLGPEGGWTEEERDLLDAQGWRAASLGHSILRAETAGIVFAGILGHLWAARAASR